MKEKKMDYNHKSVLLNECIEELNIKKDGVYLDLTVGGAGHSSEILKRIENGLLIGIDRDEEALSNSLSRLKKISPNFILAKANFKDFEVVLDELEIKKIDGVLIDLGVSSYQLDNPDRGFSFHSDSVLDMRMDQSQKKDAQYVVNNYPEEELTRIIRDYGEEKWAARIAKFIVDRRPLKTTMDLVSAIKAAVPAAARDKKHPARRTFQALRIEVNDELNIIEETIEKIVGRLSDEGRLLVISFHSLEDRIVKDSFKNMASSCICPPEYPICTCNKKSEVKIVTKKPIIASDEELEVNSRSRSAKLRIIEKR